MAAGAVRVDAQEAGPQQSEERSIGSLPAGLFDRPQNSGDHQQVGCNAQLL